MQRSPKSRPTPLSVERDRTLNALVMKPPSSRSPRLSPKPSIDERDDDDDDDYDENSTIRKLMVRQPLNPSRSRSPSTTSLRSMLVEGRWKYQPHDDDELRLETLGIGNLVRICYDIMKTTAESPARRPKSPRTGQPFTPPRLDGFKRITEAERSSLRRARTFNLMSIVYEAVSTDASMGQLVRIWREASEQARQPRREKRKPLISYKNAFEHLIRQPNDQILQIAVHASLISTKGRSDLRRLGEQLGVRRDEFDVGTIRDSLRAFQHFVQFLRARRLDQKREQQFIDTEKLPYKQRRKQGLRANVSGTRFRLSK